MTRRSFLKFVHGFDESSSENINNAGSQLTRVMFYVHDSRESNFLARKTNESRKVLRSARERSVGGKK